MKEPLVKTYHSTSTSYVSVLQDLKKHGVEVQVGPEMTTEMAPFIARFLNPQRRIIDPPYRNLNLAYGIVEALDILMNKNPGLAPKFVKRLENWMVDGKFPGHYGERLDANSTIPLKPITGVPDQLLRCYCELRDRPTSRRATVTVHNPLMEDYGSKDVACTMALQFLIRDEKLHCIAHMRSNDALWGFCYDTWLFQFLQESMASWLKVNLGHYYHIAGSFHYYHNRHKQIDKILQCPPICHRRFSYYGHPMPIELGIEDWGSCIETMWKTTLVYLKKERAISVAEHVALSIPEPFRSYQRAILAEIARKRGLGEICLEILEKMPESDVRQWVKRRCKL